MSAEFNHRQWRLAVLSMPGLTDGQKVDILTRGEHCRFEDGSNSYISQAKIAKITGHDRLQALRSDRAAVEARLLEVEKQRPGATTIYRLTRPPVTEESQVPVTEESQGCDPSITGGVTEGSHEHSSSLNEDEGSNSQAKSKIDFVLGEEEAPAAQAATRPGAGPGEKVRPGSSGHRKASRSAPPGGGTTQARTPGRKVRPASRENREVKDDWELKNSFWVDSTGTFTRLDQRAEPLAGEVRIDLEPNEAQYNFWPMKQKRRQGYMKDKYKVAKPARSSSSEEDGHVPLTFHADADPARQEVWDRVLKLFTELMATSDDGQIAEMNAAFAADLGFPPYGLSSWTMEQFNAAEDYLTGQLAARRAA